MIAAAWADRLLAGLTPTIQLHTGDPGPNGVDYVAEGVTRRPVTFTKPRNGSVSNAEPIMWLNVQRMESFTHFTAWDGGYLLSGTVTANTVYAGDNVVVDPGQLTVFFRT